VRYVQKRSEPQSLSLARAALKRTPDLACDLYEHHLSKAERKDILDNCLREQQGLCAYTGMRASGDNAHVEHLVPRSVSCPKAPLPGSLTRPYQTIEWENLVACVPGNPSGWPYGAGRKDQWPSDSEAQDFVSPLHPSCETRFRYGKQGTVKAAYENDVAATRTIDKLALHHDYLNRDRKAVLEKYLRITEPYKRRKLLATLEDRNTSQSLEFAFQCIQVLRREWAGTL
jgi:uncharacterized protein (TIGR02646 family)